MHKALPTCAPTYARINYGDNYDENKIKQVSIGNNVKVEKFIAEEHWDNLIGLDHTKAYDELASKLQHIYKSSQKMVTIKERKKDTKKEIM